MYEYEKEKQALFTDGGQRMFLSIRDRAKALLEKAGSFTLGKVIQASGGGDSFTMIACVDRLAELGEIREIHQSNCACQDRIFVGTRLG